MLQILESDDLEHYKNLRYGMKEYKRAHSDTRFVLIFKIEGEKVIFEDLDRHDRIYRR